jgi:excisionase family DNA binding protein
MSNSKASLTPLYVRIPEAQAKRIELLAVALGQSKQQVVTEILGSGLTENGSDAAAPGATDVLTLDQTATLLGVSVEAVEDAVRTAALPGRLIGGQWRFAKQAVLAWLAMPDPSIKTRPGFTSKATK